jgi:hypothetical protein
MARGDANGLAVQRVSIWHAIGQATDTIGVEYDLLTDEERSQRLTQAARHVEDYTVDGDDPTTALIALLAEGQAWLEALSAAAAR